MLSRILLLTAKTRRNIVSTNLTLCFPEWDEQTRKEKVKDVFYQNTLGIFETAYGYHQPEHKLAAIFEIKGFEKFEKALEEGRGVLLLGAHYSHLDLGGLLLAQLIPLNAIYRPHNNPLMDHYIKSHREKMLNSVIDRRDIRGIARALKNNEVVWYPPDQDYGTKHSVWAPFFGVEAATITATSRLAKLNKSPVLTILYYRDGSSRHYTLEIGDFEDSFPSGDDTIDATTVNRTLELLIRQHPTQYMWTHRRFKSQSNQKKKGQLYRQNR